jgi:hypothetical protein
MTDTIRAIILARHPTAYEIIHESGDSYSARVGGCIAYYTIRDGKIVGDVWME